MFWDSFYTTIHTNPNLSGVQKFSYLKAQLEGDAARIIAGLHSQKEIMLAPLHYWKTAVAKDKR